MVARGFMVSKPMLRGLILGVFGLGAIKIALTYPVGTATRMGPGYFPLLLGGILTALGLFNLVVAVVDNSATGTSRVAVRPLLFISLGVAGFGAFINDAGLLIAVFWLIACCCLANTRFKLIEMICIFLVVAVISSLLFVYGLTLPPSYLLPH